MSMYVCSGTFPRTRRSRDVLSPRPDRSVPPSENAGPGYVLGAGTGTGAPETNGIGAGGFDQRGPGLNVVPPRSSYAGGETGIRRGTGTSTVHACV